MSVFDETIAAGVSSNLCRALATVRDSPVTTTLEITVRSAQLAARVPPPVETFYVGEDTLEVLQSAAAHLRAETN